MKYGLRFYNKEHIRGQDEAFKFASETRAINDAKRACRNGSAFKVEVWRFNEFNGHVWQIDATPIRVYFGAVADGLREYVLEVVRPRPFSADRR